MKDSRRDEILIVGCGPTGLVLAIELARRGVRFRLIDKRDGPTMMPRAFTLHARTMEMLEHMGVVHHFLKGGIKSRGFSFNFKGKDVRPSLDFSKMDSTYPYVLIYDQGWTDKHLREHLESTYDIRPEWSTEIVGLEQGKDKCKAVLTHGKTGAKEAVEPAWIVGCDGVHSFVRKSVGLDDSGSKYDGMIMEMMDTKLDGFNGEDELVHYYISKDNFVLITKLPDGHHRIGVSGVIVNRADDQRLTQRERFQNLLDEHLEGVTLATPKLERRWEVRRRIAEKYRIGNVFLAGDAAHVHSPSGGQGMNVSMQDAYNLGWKLALVALNQASSSLLDTYASERSPVGEQVLEGTDAMHDIIMAHGQGMEDRLKLTQAKGWHESTAMRISGLSHNYCEAMSLPPELRLPNGIPPGTRAPNVKVEGERWLFDLLRHPRMSFLIVQDGESDPAETASVANSLSENFGRNANVYKVQAGERFKSSYGSYDKPHLYVIRPDGYVYCHCLLEDVPLLTNHMNEWFLPKEDLVGNAPISAKNDSEKEWWPKISRWLWQGMTAQSSRRDTYR